MTSNRAKIGFGEALGDLSSFSPSSPSKPIARPEVAAAAGFISREPVAAEVLTSVSPPVKQQRRHRTGRNVQINIKAKQETLDRFYAAVDAMGCGVGEAFEVAVDLLKRKLSGS